MGSRDFAKIKVADLSTENIIKKAEENGISFEVLYQRIKSNWDVEKAVNTPINEHRRLTKEQIETAKKNGISYVTLYQRIRNNWDIEKAVSHPLNSHRRLTNKQIETAKKNGISNRTVHLRLKRGWGVNDAITKPLQVSKYRDKWEKSIFALYHGDNLMADGTVYEIAEQTGKSVKRLQYMTYDCYNERAKKANWNNYQVMEYLGEEGEEDEI